MRTDLPAARDLSPPPPDNCTPYSYCTAYSFTKEALMSPATAPVTGTAAGVPFLAFPPATTGRTTPVVVAWHLMDPPRTESAFAAALPLAGLDAWRIYLGLPMCGARMPPGGFKELMRLGYEDAVLNLQGPITAQAAEEFPAALRELQDRLGVGNGPLGLLGGSIGAAVAQLVLVETAPAAGIPITAAVLVSPVTRLRPAVDALGRQFGVQYPWGDRSLEVALRLDFVARAEDFVHFGQPAVGLVVGADDDAEGFLEPAQQLLAALRGAYADPARADLVIVPGMAHALAEEPGLDPAPQTSSAAAVDQYTADWLTAHLSSGSAGGPR